MQECKSYFIPVVFRDAASKGASQIFISRASVLVVAKPAAVRYTQCREVTKKTVCVCVFTFCVCYLADMGLGVCQDRN